MQGISNIDVINQLDQEGKLRGLIQGGFLPAKIYLHRDIYYYLDAHIKSGISKAEAINMASAQFSKDRSTLYRILNSFAK